MEGADRRWRREGRGKRGMPGDEQGRSYDEDREVRDKRRERERERDGRLSVWRGTGVKAEEQGGRIGKGGMMRQTGTD